nr:MAG TPA: hypothetical protein [Caudoviricetes sp.]
MRGLFYVSLISVKCIAGNRNFCLQANYGLP